MWRTIALLCLWQAAAVTCQYPYNPNAIPYTPTHHYGAPAHPHQNSASHRHFGLTSYPGSPAGYPASAASPASAFGSGSVPSSSSSPGLSNGGGFQSAPVHYVSIGPQLQGDYKFGYSTGGSSGGNSFREETRLPDGSVKGAYGYIDASGKMRIIRYTAGKDGFKAEGDLVPEQGPQGPSAATPNPLGPNPAVPAHPAAFPYHSNHFNQAAATPAQNLHPTSTAGHHQQAGPLLSYNINLNHH